MLRYTTDSSPPSSSPPQDSSILMQSQVDSSLNQDHPPSPSSSPSQSSSPSAQFVEISEGSSSMPLDEGEVDSSVPSVDPPLETNLQFPELASPSNPTSLGTQISESSGSIETVAGGLDEPLSLLHKRKREEEELTAQPPNPKRATLASQKLQHKTLAKPFRSPAMKTPKALEPAVAPPLPKKESTPFEQPFNDSNLKKLKHRTQRAAGQFKSPLSLSTAGSSSVSASVRQTPTIQILERKVQILKRAVKIRNEGEAKTLESLVKKWTEAGREVAFEVWELVKDTQSTGGDGWGKESQGTGSGKRRFEDSWGWNGESGSKRIKAEETDQNWGWDSRPATGHDEEERSEPAVESVEEDKPQETLGTMLMRLGIAPSTLGWNDDKGEFVD